MACIETLTTMHATLISVLSTVKKGTLLTKEEVEMLAQINKATKQLAEEDSRQEIRNGKTMMEVCDKWGVGPGSSQ